MKQKIYKIAFAIMILCLFMIPSKVSAANGYTVEGYHIDMIVNEDNTFDITEVITVDYSQPKHGIYRKIPLENTVTRSNGVRTNNKAKVNKIKVSKKYKTSNQDGYKVIKIGDDNSTLTGTHTYTIQYKYSIGKDPLKDVDELYYNLIGDQWDTTIENMSFSITMPKSFAPSTLGFSTGRYGSTNSDNVTYNISGNTITGKVNEKLGIGSGVTLRLTLPEGYFSKANLSETTYFIEIVVVCGVCILIADRLWKKYGKDDTVVETVEFYPPEGCNSAELAFLYKGEVGNNEIISLLIYLANKGYIEICEDKESSQKDFKITKQKEYDGEDQNEKSFLDGLFEGSKTISIEKLMKKENLTWSQAEEIVEQKDDGKVSVNMSELHNKFYSTLNVIKERMNEEENKRKIFDASASGKVKWILLMIMAIFALITVKPVLEYGASDTLIFATLFPFIGFIVLISSLINVIKMPKIYAIMWSSLFGGMPFLLMVLPTLIQNTSYFILFVIGIISIVILTLFAKIMPKRTPYGTEMLGKIRGFKRFLEIAEKPQLEALVNENPEYFYDILPYTYALGVSNIWIKQFKTIAVQAPNWYNGYETFTIDHFSHFMDDTMFSAQTSMMSQPNNSRSLESSSGDFGSSSSGGGFSGGGSW